MSLHYYGILECYVTDSQTASLGATYSEKLFYLSEFQTTFEIKCSEDKLNLRCLYKSLTVVWNCCHAKCSQQHCEFVII